MTIEGLLRAAVGRVRAAADAESRAWACGRLADDAAWLIASDVMAAAEVRDALAAAFPRVDRDALEAGLGWVAAGEETRGRAIVRAALEARA